MTEDTGIHLRTLGPVALTRPDGSEISSVLSQPKRLALLVCPNYGFHTHIDDSPSCTVHAPMHRKPSDTSEG